MDVRYTEMEKADRFDTIFYFIHTIQDVSSINLGMVRGGGLAYGSYHPYPKYPIPKHFTIYAVVE